MVQLKLKYVSIWNYRCLKKFLKFPIKDISVLIGPNDTGKSCFLYALNHFFNNISFSLEDYCTTPNGYRTTDPIKIEAVFSIKLENKDDPKIDKIPLTSEGLLHVQKLFPFGEKIQSLAKTMVYQDKRFQNIEMMPANEVNELRKGFGIDIRKRGRVSKKENIEAIMKYAEEQELPKEEGWIPLQRDIETILPEFILFKADEALTVSSGPLQRVLEEVYIQILEKEKERIDVLEREIKKALDKKVSELTEIAKKHVPNISELKTIPAFHFEKAIRTNIQVTDMSGRSTPFENRGDGCKRGLMVAIFRWTRDLRAEMEDKKRKTIIWGFDEPSIYLHPGAQRLAYYVLKELSKTGIQIILCTHSTIFVDRASLNSINLVEQDSNGASNHRHLTSVDQMSINEFTNTIKFELGMQNSDLFYDNCYILVEGKTEAIALPLFYQTLYNTTLDEEKIKLVNLEGCQNAPGIVKFFAKNNFPYVLLLDSDAQSAISRSQLTLDSFKARKVNIKGLIHFIGQVEFEDAFSNDIIAKALNKSYRRVDQKLWDISDIEDFRNQTPIKFTDVLEKEVGKECKFQFKKRDFGRTLGEVCQAKSDIPNPIIHVFKHARKLSKIS